MSVVGLVNTATNGIIVTAPTMIAVKTLRLFVHNSFQYKTARSATNNGTKIRSLWYA
ncbi:MAG: hypothetical protein ACD_48C00183G0002 [uncultured bacterium]|nr:MAG: hypothetical protein ACD_48C00183G0002 [uncultured bacterium]